MSLAQLTKPFEIIHNESENVLNKYLEGQPYRQSFPGPFQGLTHEQKTMIAAQQKNAVNNWHNIAEKPLSEQSSLYPSFNAGFTHCGQYGNGSDIFPPVHLQQSSGPSNAVGINMSENIQRQRPLMQWPYQIGQGSSSGMPEGGLNGEGRFGKDRQSGSNHPVERMPQGMNEAALAGTYNLPRKSFSVENFENGSSNSIGIVDFKDESITDPCNQTGFGEIVPKFNMMPESTKAWSSSDSSQFVKCSSDEYPLLDIENRPVEQFSHNNMVPFYGSKLTQNMHGTNVAQAGDNNSCKGLSTGFADVTPYRDKLQTFTGCDEMYMHKRETPPMFSPAEQTTGWVFGTPAFRPELDRYKDTLWRRNNETPIEKQRVGPGIGLDYSVPAQGGFHQFTRVLPNNVNDYKANQLEGRVNAGKWFTNHPTSQYIYGVNKDKPDLTITQARRPTMPTKFYTNAPDAGDSRITDWSTSLKRGKQARPDTEQGAGFGQLNLTEYVYDGSGNLVPKRENFTSLSFQTPDGSMPCVDFGIAPVGKVMGSVVPMPVQNRLSYNNIRETFKKGAAGYDEEKGFWECKDSTQGAHQWNVIMGPAKGIVPTQESRQGKYVNFTDRGDVNPYVINVTGTVQTGGQWSPNSWQDQQKVTTKETTEFSYIGNPSGSNKKQSTNTWSDLPKVTTKETTEFAHVGNPKGQQTMYENTWSDLPKVTTKETTEFAHVGNAKSKNNNATDRFMYTGSDYVPLKK